MSYALYRVTLVTHADSSCMSIALIHVCLCVYHSVFTHDKTKTAETNIAKLSTEIVYHDTFPPINIRSSVRVMVTVN